MSGARMVLSAASIATPFVSPDIAIDVVLAADHAVPQPAGVAITWTAMTSGLDGPCEYKWLVYDGARWDVAQNWSASDAFTWKPAFANTRDRVAVQVRGLGDTGKQVEASTEAAFAIEPAASRMAVAIAAIGTKRLAPLAVSPVSTVMLSSDRPSPQAVDTAITLTAAATGGGTGRHYKWFVYDGSRWKSAAAWSISDTFVWTPTRPNERWRIAVWARSADSTSDHFDACSEIEFAIRPSTA